MEKFIFKHRKTLFDSGVEYAKKLMENPENRCIRKKHITNGYSEIYKGENNWEVATDREVYDKFTNDIAMSTSNKLDEHEDLNPSDKLINELAEMSLDRHIIQKEYLKLFNLSRSQLISIIINLSKKI